MALVIVYTPDTYYYLLVVHAPQENEFLPYATFWLGMSANITALIDNGQLLILGDINSVTCMRSATPPDSAAGKRSAKLRA